METPVDTIPAQLDHEWKKGLGERFDRQDKILDALVKRQDSQDQELGEIKRNGKAAVEFFSAWDGAMRFFNMVGKLTKPILGAVAVASAAWSAWHLK